MVEYEVAVWTFSHEILSLVLVSQYTGSLFTISILSKLFAMLKLGLRVKSDYKVKSHWQFTLLYVQYRDLWCNLRIRITKTWKILPIDINSSFHFFKQQTNLPKLLHLIKSNVPPHIIQYQCSTELEVVSF